MGDKVNWDLVNKLFEDPETTNLIFKPFGLPEIVSPNRSMMLTEDVDIQPAWTDIPDKIAISTAVTGGMYSNIGNPNHPMTQEQIYNSAREACLAGAPIVHIHVRGEEGYSHYYEDRYRSMLGDLKKEFPNVFFDTCLVVGDPTIYQNMLKFVDDGFCEATPVNCNALLYGDTLFCKPPHMIIKKAHDLQEHNCKPLLAIYTDGDVENANRFLIKSGVLKKPYVWAIVPGVPGCIPMNNVRSMVDGLRNTVDNIKDIDEDSIIMVCCGGRASSYVATLAIMMGLNIRIGMEDTPWKWPHKEDFITNNAEEFLRYKQLAHILGREVMSADEYRKLLGLK